MKGPRLKPGSGTIVADLGRRRIVTLDLMAFVNALHREILSWQGQAGTIMAVTWREMAETALVNALDDGSDGHATT